MCKKRTSGIATAGRDCILEPEKQRRLALEVVRRLRNPEDLAGGIGRTDESARLYGCRRN